MTLLEHFRMRIFPSPLHRESRGLFFSLDLFHRSDSWFELNYRFGLMFGVEQTCYHYHMNQFKWRFVWSLVTISAWREEPTVVAEYKRTMETGCETPSVRWKRLQEQEASLPSVRQGTQTPQHNAIDPWSAEDLVRSVGEETIEGRFLRRGLDRWGMGIAKRNTTETSSS